MARKHQPHVTELALAAPDDLASLDPSALEEYEPPPLTPQRLAALAQRRAEVAAAGVPEGLRGAAAQRLRAAAAAAAVAPDVAITYDVSLRSWRLLQDYSYAYQDHVL